MCQEVEEMRIKRGEKHIEKHGPDEDDPTYEAWMEKWNELDMETEVWPQNKRCFQNIIDCLTDLFPVEKIEIDPRFSES